MEHINKEAIQEHLLEAMRREELHNRKVAEFLNLNPCYISMLKNPNSWAQMGVKPWERLNDWHESRCKLSEFVIPEGEERVEMPVYVPKEKRNSSALQLTEAEAKFVKEIPTESAIKNVEDQIAEQNFNDRIAGKKLPRIIKPRDPKRQRQGKSVVLAFGKAEILALNKKYEALMAMMNNAMESIAVLKGQKELAEAENQKAVDLLTRHIETIEETNKVVRSLKDDHDNLDQSYFVFTDETLPVMIQRIHDLEKRVSEVKISGKERQGGIVIFQRNYHQQ